MKRTTQKRLLLWAVLLFVLLFAMQGSASTVKLSSAKIYMPVNTSISLKLQGVSSKANVKWTWTKKAVASVKKTANHKVKIIAGNKAGKMKIKAKFAGKSYYCTVYVMSFKASNSTTISLGGTTKLSFSKKPAIKWSTSNAAVARVSKEGVVTAVGEGKCYIYAVIAKKRYKTQIAVQKPQLSTANMILRVNTYQVLGMNVKDDMTFQSGDTSIVSLRTRDRSSVYVCADREGTTTVTAKVNGLAYVCTVTVTGRRSDLNARIDSTYANGLYSVQNDGTTSGYPGDLQFMMTVSGGKKYRQYFFIYNGKAYLPYELPKAVEVSLLKGSNTIFSSFFGYLQECRRIYADPTVSGLIAISHFMHEQGWTYDLNANTDPIFGLPFEQKGLCVHFSNTMQYLCYLADIPTLVIGCSYQNSVSDHDVNAVYYNGYWYFIEPQTFLYTTIESVHVGYFGNASLATIDPLTKEYSNLQQNKCFTLLPTLAQVMKVPQGESALEAAIQNALTASEAAA